MKNQHGVEIIPTEVAKNIREREVFDDRNIIDKYKGWDNQDISEDLAENSTKLVALLNNSIRDFNWGTVVRNGNGFGLSQVVFCGRTWRDRRGAVGAHHYTNVSWAASLIDTINYFKQQGYTVVAAENPDDREVISLYEYIWDEKSVIVFGEEGTTLPDEILDVMDDIVFIPMRGSVRSFNVGTASGIFFNSYNEQRG